MTLIFANRAARGIIGRMAAYHRRHLELTTKEADKRERKFCAAVEAQFGRKIDSWLSARGLGDSGVPRTHITDNQPQASCCSFRRKFQATQETTMAKAFVRSVIDRVQRARAERKRFLDSIKAEVLAARQEEPQERAYKPRAVTIAKYKQNAPQASFRPSTPPM